MIGSIWCFVGFYPRRQGDETDERFWWEGSQWWTLCWRRRLNTRGDWWTAKSVGVNGKEISTELKNYFSERLNKCIEGEEAGEDGGHRGLQKHEVLVVTRFRLWPWGGMKKRPLEMKRSRKQRTQGAGMDMGVVNLTEVDKRGLCRQEDWEAGPVALGEQGHDLVIESGRRTFYQAGAV